MQKLARDAYRAIGAEGFARDRLPRSRASEIYLSEINTIPGFTPISLFPTMPAEGGYTFADVCVRIVELALERHAGRVRRAPAGPRTCRGERAPIEARARRRRALAGDSRHAARRSGGPKPVKRASAGLSPIRAGAALAMLLSRGRDLRRRCVVRVRVTRSRDRRRGLHRARTGRDDCSTRSVARTCSASRPPRSSRGSASCRPCAMPRSALPLPGRWPST